MYFCLDITLIKYLKGLKSQKSLFVSKLKSGSDSVTQWLTQWLTKVRYRAARAAKHLIKINKHLSISCIPLSRLYSACSGEKNQKKFRSICTIFHTNMYKCPPKCLQVSTEISIKIYTFCAKSKTFDNRQNLFPLSVVAKILISFTWPQYLVIMIRGVICFSIRGKWRSIYWKRLQRPSHQHLVSEAGQDKKGKAKM